MINYISLRYKNFTYTNQVLFNGCDLTPSTIYVTDKRARGDDNNYLYFTSLLSPTAARVIL